MLNRVILQGRLVADPELRHTQSGVPVASFRIAVDRSYASRDASGNRQNQTDFFSAVAWRQTGEFVSRNFAKGSMLLIEGQLREREYTDRDENRRTTVEVVADSVYFCGSRRADEGRSAPSGGVLGATHSESLSANPGLKAEQKNEQLRMWGGAYKPPAEATADAFAELTDDDGELPF